MMNKPLYISIRKVPWWSRATWISLRKASPESERGHRRRKISLVRIAPKNTERYKRDQHVRNQLHAIEDSIKTNHFWNTLNKQKHEDVPNQNGDVWVNHLSDLFGPIEKYKEQKHIQDKLQSLESTIKEYKNPLDSPITSKELQDEIKSLETKKACGVHAILNGMIKFAALQIIVQQTISSPPAS